MRGPKDRNEERKKTTTIMNLTTLSYGWKRITTEGTTIATGSQSNKGTVAGCVAATRKFKAYLSKA